MALTYIAPSIPPPPPHIPSSKSLTDFPLALVLPSNPTLSQVVCNMLCPFDSFYGKASIPLCQAPRRIVPPPFRLSGNVYSVPQRIHVRKENKIRTKFTTKAHTRCVTATVKCGYTSITSLTTP